MEEKKNLHIDVEDNHTQCSIITLFFPDLFVAELDSLVYGVDGLHKQQGCFITNKNMRHNLMSQCPEDVGV